MMEIGMKTKCKVMENCTINPDSWLTKDSGNLTNLREKESCTMRFLMN